MTQSFERLCRRADFVAAGKGTRHHSDDMAVQTRDRDMDGAPRFGITITKKTAPRAVDRNRIRRRLREALRLGAALCGAQSHDYVIVGRKSLLSLPFEKLRASVAGNVEAATQRSRRRSHARTVQSG